MNATKLAEAIADYIADAEATGGQWCTKGIEDLVRKHTTIDRMVPITLDTKSHRTVSETTVLFHKSGGGQTFAALHVREADVMRALRGDTIWAHFHMWEGPKD